MLTNLFFYYICKKISGKDTVLIPIIQIDSSETRNLDIAIDLQKIYYQPVGYQRTAKKLYEAFQKAGFDFSLDEVGDWLERQAVYQIHKSRPRYIPRASFCSITIPNEVHQADILYMPYDKIGRYKASIPIGSRSIRVIAYLVASLALCLGEASSLHGDLKVPFF